jgi:chromosome segregation ATPase
MRVAIFTEIFMGKMCRSLLESNILIQFLHVRMSTGPERSEALRDKETGQRERGEDVVLWLAVENEVLRRASRNDRETITALRAQLHAARRALRTLHAQGGALEKPGSAGHEQQQHHQCIIAQLSNLDRLALDWARRCETFNGEARELCQLRVEHAQVLEASQALRAAHEATIHSLQGELASSRDRGTHADGQVAALLATRDTLTVQVAQISSRAHVMERECAELESGMHALERNVRFVEDGLTSLDAAVHLRLQSLLRDIADSRAAQAKDVDTRKQRDVQVRAPWGKLTRRVQPAALAGIIALFAAYGQIHN